jgi:hypothetical protein
MRLCIATAALLLAACGQNASGNQQAANETKARANPPAAAAADGPGIIQPGEWEMTTVTEMPDMPNLPPGVRMPAVRPASIRHCVTPADVARGNKAFLGGGGTQHGVDCDYSGVTFAGGRIQGTSRCSRADMQMSMTMDGTFGPTAYEIDQRIHTTVRGRTRDMHAHMSARRIGDCPAAGSQGAEGDKP